MSSGVEIELFMSKTGSYFFYKNLSLIIMGCAILHVQEWNPPVLALQHHPSCIIYGLPYMESFDIFRFISEDQTPALKMMGGLAPVLSFCSLLWCLQMRQSFRCTCQEAGCKLLLSTTAFYKCILPLLLSLFVILRILTHVRHSCINFHLQSWM